MLFDARDVLKQYIREMSCEITELLKKKVIGRDFDPLHCSAHLSNLSYFSIIKAEINVRWKKLQY